MKKINIFLLCLLLSAQLLKAQLNSVNTLINVVEWQRALGGTGDDKVISATKTADLGYIMFGNTNSTNGDVVGNHGAYDIWVVKTDSVGTFQWQVCLGGTGWEQLKQVFPLAHEHFLLLGSTRSNNGNVSGNHGDLDGWVVEIDSLGAIQWQRCLGGTGRDSVKKGALQNGNLTIFGSTASNDGDVVGNHGLIDIWTVTIDSVGNVIQQRCSGGTQDDYYHNMLVDYDNHYIVEGFTGSLDGDVTTNGHLVYSCAGSNPKYYWMLSLDSLLAVQWNLVPDTAAVDAGFGFNEATFLSLAQDSGFWFVYPLVNSCDGNILTRKLSSTGGVEWQDTFLIYSFYAWSNSGPNEEPYSLFQLTPTGGIINKSSVYFTNGAGPPPGGEAHSREYDANGNVLSTCDIAYTYNNNFCHNSAAMTLNQLPNPVLAGALLIDPEVYNANYYYPNHVDYTGYGYNTFLIYREILGNRIINVCNVYNLFPFVVGGQGGQDFWIGAFGAPNNSFSGTVWKDDNNNNTLDIGEELEDRIVQTNLSTYGTFYMGTDTAGKYEMHIGTGNFTTSLLTPLYYTVSPTQYVDSFTTNNNTNVGNDFQLIPVGNIQDMRVTVTALNDPNPGFDTHYNLSYENVGTINTSGYVRYDLDPAQTFVSASINPDTVASDHLSWNYTNYAPFSHTSIDMILNTSVGVGPFMYLWGTLYPLIGDSTQADNMLIDSVATFGAFDPNEVAVSHSKVDTVFSTNEEYLTYTIRFQNTGTDTAVNIVVKDYIFSTQVHFETVEVLASSAPYQIDMEGYLIRFSFANIMLPDSNASEIDSHGFIKFRIKVKNTWYPCDTIQNYADIYFDFNDSVRTNTAKTSLKLPKPVITASNWTACFSQGAIILHSNVIFPYMNYLWNNNSIQADLTVAAPSGTFPKWVTISYNGCVETSDTVYTTIYQIPNPPVITVIGNDTFCQGQSVILSGPNNANYTYTWSDGTSTKKDTITQAGAYSLIVTNQYGCSRASTNATNVVVQPIPSATITPNGSTTFCQGDTLTLSAPAGLSTYSWSNGATTQNIDVLTSGTYSVTITNTSFGLCSTAVSIPIIATVNPLPIATITANASLTFCQGNDVVLTSNANNGNLWSNSQTTDSIIVTATGTYYVTVTDSNNCSATSSSVMVTVNPLPPVPTISQTQNTLTSSANTGNQWYFNTNLIAGANNASYNAIQSGTYTTFVTDTNGCSSTSADFLFTYLGITNGLTAYNIRCYPNPVHETLYIAAENIYEKAITVSIFDATGKEVLIKNYAVQGDILLEIPIKQFTKGIYLVKIQTKVGYFMQEVVVD